jgi:undecaprenyl-diphosphatase
MVASFFHAITEFIAAHPYWAYEVVFLLALSESIPVIGVFIPGTAAILAISALVPSGVVQLWPLMGAATAGAIVSDGLSFWIGHRYHREILQRWPLNRHPELVTRSEAFFARHGDKSVFIARFAPGVRAFVPLIAGILRMPVRRFYVANILSALAWAPSHILPAVFVGAAFSTFGPAARPLAILVVLIVVAIWALIHLIRLALRHAPRLMAALSEQLRQRAAISQSRWGRIALTLLDPLRSDARALGVLALILIGSAWLFFGILEDVINGDPLVRADVAIHQALQELGTVPGDRMMLMITELGDTVVVIAVTLAVLAWLAYRRAWRPAAFWLAAVAGASTLNTVIKVALHRERPVESFYTGWGAFSFPSGHSTVNLVLWGFLALLIGRELRPAWRLPLAFVTLSFALLIAFSRLYLGVHWFSDAVGGLAFGTAWLAMLGFFYLRKPAPPVNAVSLGAVAALALALAGGLNVYHNHARDFERYAVNRVLPTMMASEWGASGWQELPDRRIDLTGQAREPLTLQWAGELATVQQTLQGRGWRLPAAWAPMSTLGWLTTTTPPPQLPVVPYLASGKPASLTLIMPDAAAPNESRFVLRLWDADLDLVDNSNPVPLWIGSVVKERIAHPLSLFTLVVPDADANAPRDLLESGRLVVRPAAEADMNWDGQVRLLR